jgi:hypothetical protein
MSNRFARFIALLLFMASSSVFAQNQVDDGKPWLKAPDTQRAWVYIKNDYTNTIKLTMWTKRGAQVGDAWVLEPGKAGYLVEGSQKITASPEYVIKVGDDPGEVALYTVSERHGQTWNVSVRKIWLATHQKIEQQK